MRLLVGERLKYDVRFEGETPLEAALVHNFPDMAVLLQRLPVQLLCAVCTSSAVTECVKRQSGRGTEKGEEERGGRSAEGRGRWDNT